MAGYLDNRRICVTGGAGFLGRAVCSRLRATGVSDAFVPRSRDYDLTREGDISRLFDDARPDVIIHLAAEVGGIGANQRRPGRFFYANLAMGMQLIEAARRRGIAKFVQVGTVCSYPKHCPVPFHEDELWNGFPEETNAPYGVAKRALGVMLEAYRAEYGFNGVIVIPVNLFGPGDNFDPETSHVIPAMIRKFQAASDQGESRVVLWGSGKASREFLFVDDAASGIVAATALHNDSRPINLGTGREVRIADLAELVARRTGFHGEIVWDATRPDGQPRRRLDTSRAQALLGWTAAVELEDGLDRTIAWWRGERRQVTPQALITG